MAQLDCHPELLHIFNSITNTDNSLLQAMLDLPVETLTSALAHLAIQAKIKIDDIKKVHARHIASFSDAKWSKLAPRFNLPNDYKLLDLEPHFTIHCRLPGSFHVDIFKRAWGAQDVYGEEEDRTNEAANVRLMDTYIIPILALFHGRIYDKPEENMKASEYSTGGRVEHEIMMIGGALFVIVEDKLHSMTGNNIAQIFQEFLSSAEENFTRGFMSLRVHGVLTNFADFKFYSYDPVTRQFYFDEVIRVPINDRLRAGAQMIQVTNKIFSIVLSGYVDGLRLIVQQERDRKRENEPHDLPRISIPHRQNVETYISALRDAESSLKKFKEIVFSLEDLEATTNEALRLLTHSVRSIRRPTHLNSNEDPSTEAELQALAARIVKEEDMLYVDACNEKWMSQLGH